jgi:hypothetical protein
MTGSHSFRHLVQGTLVWLAAAAGATILAAIVVAGGGLALVFLAAACVAVAAMGRYRKGIVAGILLLAVLNGIPLVDTERVSTALGILETDLFVLALVGVLGWWTLMRPQPLAGEPGRLLLAWSAAFAAWWLVTVTRTVVMSDVPPLEAAIYGRDFLYAAVLAPLAFAVFHERSAARALAATLGIGAVIFASAQLVRAAFGIDVSAFIHTELATETEAGLIRDFTEMASVVTAAAAFGVGIAAVSATTRMRVAGAGLALLAATATALQFVRAIYLGLAVGLIAATALWSVQPGPVAARIRRAAGAVAATLVLVFAVSELVGIEPSPDSPVAAIRERIVVGGENVATQTGTFGYRYEVGAALLGELGDRWVLGAGFLDPNFVYFPGVPQGSIRNPDLGVLNGVATIGLVGTILLYLPLIAGIAFLVRTARYLRPDARDDAAWSAFGGTVWLLAIFTASLTLVTLYNVPGIALVAVGGAAACARAATARTQGLRVQRAAVAEAPRDPLVGS